MRDAFAEILNAGHTGAMDPEIDSSSGRYVVKTKAKEVHRLDQRRSTAPVGERASDRDGLGLVTKA